MPIDFSNSNQNFSGFGGASFQIIDDLRDSNNKVGEISNTGASAVQGIFLDLSRSINLDQNKTISVSFFTPNNLSNTLTLKLEQGTNPDVEIAESVSSSGWHTISYDFSNATISGTENLINANGSYNRIVLFVDLNNTSTGTYLIDNIDDGSSPIGDPVLDVTYSDLVWSDEFNVNGPVDTEKWFLQTQLPVGTGGNWFNGEVQHYTNRETNAFVQGGFLHVVAKRELYTDQGETKQFTSARLNSKFAFTYGRIDVRAKLPEGEGTWPAIWTLGRNIDEDGAYWDNEGFGTTAWPSCGEIDIMEHGLGETNHVSSAIHTPSSFGGTINTKSKTLVDVANNFYVYSVNWSPDQIHFLIDNEIYYSYDPDDKNANTWPFDLEQYLLLNVAMGGIAGAIDPNFTESSMIIDYVRIYQNNPLSVQEFRNSSKNDIYFDTASNYLDIHFEEKKFVELGIFDGTGKLVLLQEKMEVPTRVSLNGYPSGIYFVKINMNRTLQFVEKIMIR